MIYTQTAIPYFLPIKHIKSYHSFSYSLTYMPSGSNVFHTNTTNIYSFPYITVLNIFNLFDIYTPIYFLRK